VVAGDHAVRDRPAAQLPRRFVAMYESSEGSRRTHRDRGDAHGRVRAQPRVQGGTRSERSRKRVVRLHRVSVGEVRAHVPLGRT